MVDVVGIGLNAIDYLVGLPRFPVPGEKLRMSAFAREGGGQVATALVALSRWGRRCKYVGNVGDDEHGRLSSRLLSQEGVDLAHLRTVPGASSQFAVILVEEDTGERTIPWDRDPRIRVSPEDLPLDDIRRARALLLDGHDVLPGLSCRGMGGRAAIPTIGAIRAAGASPGRQERGGLMTHDSTPEGAETIRRRIRALLEEGPLTAKEISSAVRRPEKEIANHLEHLKKSLHSDGRRLSQVPAECRGCGFVFRKRERLKAPSRCPICKGEAISDPAFRVQDG